MAATLLLNLPRADALPPAGVASKLAQLAAVLDPNGIPETILTSQPAQAFAGATSPAEARRALLNL